MATHYGIQRRSDGHWFGYIGAWFPDREDAMLFPFLTLAIGFALTELWLNHDEFHVEAL